ncbi:ABC transporter permease [Phytohabitans kaempferiae]|uniref:ABC transporter permease n=1 Tax=Phytohabitans kaempferiae TaxID=1620943 RepID=A0ABV6M7V0_9ACTN
MSTSDRTPVDAPGRLRIILIRVGLVAGLLLLWQALPGNIVPVDLVGRPSQVLVDIWDLFATGTIFPDLWATTYEMLLGSVIALPAGVVVAALTVALPPLAWLLRPILAVLYAIPKVVLLSVFVLVLGIGSQSKIGLVVSFVAFVYYLYTVRGLRDVDEDRAVALRRFGAGPLFIARALTLPTAVPHLLAAFRTAIPLAYSVAIFAELNITSERGLGSLIGRAAGNLDPSRTIAVIAIVAAIGFGIDIVLVRLLRRYSASVGLQTVTL